MGQAFFMGRTVILFNTIWPKFFLIDNVKNEKRRELQSQVFIRIAKPFLLMQAAIR